MEFIKRVARAERVSVLHLRGGFAVQIHRGRLRVSVSQARKENRRGSGLRDHPARLRFAQVPRAEDAIWTSAGCVRRCSGTCTSCRCGRPRNSPRASLPAAGHRKNWSNRFALKSMPPPIRDWPRAWNAPRRWSRSSGALGYAGAYIGGDHQADRIRWIIKRSEALAPQWEELAAELEWAPKGGFYFFEGPKHRAASRRRSGTASRTSSSRPTRRARLRGVLTGVLRLIDKSPCGRACAGKRRARVQEAGVRMPGLRQLRSGLDGICLPDDVS